MIIKLTVDNYKSFENESEIVFIQSSKISEHKEHIKKINSEISALEYGVLYGANSSGKSNIIKSMMFIQNVLRGGLLNTHKNNFCRLKSENIKRDSLFELQFSIGNKIYAYGFSTVLNQLTITSEWLYELKSRGRSSLIFEYSKEKDFEYNKSLFTGNDKKRLETYKQDFIFNKNRLFLSELNANKRYDADSKLAIFNRIFSYITGNIVVMFPETITITNKWFHKDTFQQISDEISKFDTGISKMEFKQIDVSDLGNIVPQEVIQQMLPNAYQVHDMNTQISSITIHNDQMFITNTTKGVSTVYKLNIKHKLSDYTFDFNEESKGTIRLFWLLNLLINQENDMTYLVDELDNSLHPKLTEQFIKVFNKYHLKDNTQLFFTSHESYIMNLNLFRRDEIWFVEKDDKNISKIYSLDRFKERYDKVIDKAYLDGRYGAVPIFEETLEND